MEHLPGIWEVMGSIPVRDSEFFFVPCLCHVDQFTFHKVTVCYTVIYLINCTFHRKIETVWNFIGVFIIPIKHYMAMYVEIQEFSFHFF